MLFFFKQLFYIELALINLIRCSQLFVAWQNANFVIHIPAPN